MIGNTDKLIQEAEAHGAAFRLNEGRVEVYRLRCLPSGLVQQLRVHSNEVGAYLAATGAAAHGDDGSRLLAWAAELAEHDITLPDSVTFVGKEGRKVCTRRVGLYACGYLCALADARLKCNFQIQGSHIHQMKVSAALSALRALHLAVEPVMNRPDLEGGK